MADLYIADVPTCPVHGQMHRDDARCQWACAGWDGEGCDHVVPDEAIAWRLIGTTGPSSGISLDWTGPP